MTVNSPHLSGKRALIRVFFLVSSLVLFLLPSGCAKKHDIVKTDKEILRHDYAIDLGAWTRSAKIYEGFEARLYISATYKGPEFVKAYIERYAQGYQLGPELKATMLERGLEASEMYNEFFIAVFTPEDAWNSFIGQGAMWKLYLEDSSGNRLSPISITKVDSSDPLIREFFPYFDHWSTGYAVKFPKYTETGLEPIPGPDTRSIRLKVTGVLGKGELEWKLKEK